MTTRRGPDPLSALLRKLAVCNDPLIAGWARKLLRGAVAGRPLPVTAARTRKPPNT
jgi:hypothetical protein